MQEQRARLADRLALTGGAGFLVFGILAAIPGPLLPALRGHFQLDAGTASIVFGVFAAGTVLGAVLAGAVLARRSSRWALGTGFAILLVGCALTGTARTWPIVVVGFALTGVGFGCLQLAFHVVLASGYGERSASMLTAVTSAFGVGAVAGPILVGFTPSDFRTPYLLCAVAAAVLLPLAVSVRVVASSAPEATPAGDAGRRRTMAVAGFGLLLCGDVAFEAGVAGWATTHLLEDVGLSAPVAVRSLALFFGGLSLGRIIAAPLTARVRPGPLLVGALLLAAASLGLATVNGAALAGYALAGLFIAPVFPTTFAWMTRTAPSGRGRTAVFAAAMAGPIVVAPVTGAIVNVAGAGSIPLTLGALALFDAAVALWLTLTVRAPRASVTPASRPVTGAVSAGLVTAPPHGTGGGWVRPAAAVAGVVAVAGLVALGTRRRRWR